MRCPDCNKFVSFDEPVGEIEYAEINDARLNVCARIVLCCAECNAELRQSSFEEEHDLECDHDGKEGEYEFDVTSEEATAGERMQATDKKGKPVKARFQKKFYTLEYTIHVSCSCGKDQEIEGQFEEQASNMEDLLTYSHG